MEEVKFRCPIMDYYAIWLYCLIWGISPGVSVDSDWRNVINYNQRHRAPKLSIAKSGSEAYVFLWWAQEINFVRSIRTEHINFGWGQNPTERPRERGYIQITENRNLKSIIDFMPVAFLSFISGLPVINVHMLM